MGGISVLFMMGMVSAFLIIFIWMFIACLIYSVVRYVLEGISVMRMAERLGWGISTAALPGYRFITTA